MDKKCSEIYNTLEKVIENPVCELEFNNPYELLVAVILSAQCTDKRVNMVTKDLFKKYGTVESLANANIGDVENIIKPCGFYKNKARNIVNACADIVNKYGGQVPNNKNELLTLSGVGVKTANVVLAEAYGVPTIAVDTHVLRVSNRLGIAKSKDVGQVETQLQNNFDKSTWVKLHHMLILFGRYYCKSRNPQCNDCVLSKYCDYYKEKK